MELHDKIISSACESKLADFVMFVSSGSLLFYDPDFPVYCLTAILHGRKVLPVTTRTRYIPVTAVRKVVSPANRNLYFIKAVG
jgi:hypothetical protein